MHGSVQDKQAFFEENYFDQADFKAIEEVKIKRANDKKIKNFKNGNQGKSHVISYLSTRTSGSK